MTIRVAFSNNMNLYERAKRNSDPSNRERSIAPRASRRRRSRFEFHKRGQLLSVCTTEKRFVVTTDEKTDSISRAQLFGRGVSAYEKLV